MAKAIGADMPARSGFLEYRVVQDIADAGHLLVATRWDSSASAAAVLAAYAHDPKVQRATELIGTEPAGFVGEVLTH